MNKRHWTLLGVVFGIAACAFSASGGIEPATTGSSPPDRDHARFRMESHFERGTWTVFVLDSDTGQVWVRERQQDRWQDLGHPSARQAVGASPSGRSRDEDRELRMARRVFKIVDQNRNGKVESDEWTVIGAGVLRSLYPGLDARIEPSLKDLMSQGSNDIAEPLTEAEFLEAFIVSFQKYLQPLNFPEAKNEESQERLETAHTREARSYFQLLDQNKDNVIQPDEWQRSLRLKRHFEAAGIDLSQPFDEKQFVEHYQNATPASRGPRR